MASFKKPTKDEKTDAPKARVDNDTGFWLNKTRSGKGVIIVIEDAAYISSVTNLQEFVAGDRRGVRFNLLKPKEDTDEEKEG